MNRTHLDLFSGIGGFSMAAGWCGYETIAFCEIEPYAQQVLIKKFGAVMADANTVREQQPKRVKQDQRRRIINSSQAVADADHPGPQGQGRSELCQCSGELSAGPGRTRIFSNIKTLDGKQFRGVTLLTAGVPCQPASCAGKQRGAADDRWLWPEALRILREANPLFAIFENPTGILSLNGGLEFERVLVEVESQGYSVQPIIVPACAVDAKHRRDRVWIICARTDLEHSDRKCVGSNGGRNMAGEVLHQAQREESTDPSCGSGKDVAHSKASIRRRPNGKNNSRRRDSETGRCGESGCGIQHGRIKPKLCGIPARLPYELDGHCHWPEENPEVPRVAQGIPNRASRLRCLGNSIVPQAAHQLIKLLTP